MECDKATKPNYRGPSSKLRGNQSSFPLGTGSRGLVKGRKKGEQG